MNKIADDEWSVFVADLLEEKVADLLQQDYESGWVVVEFGVGPKQRDCVHQRSDQNLDLRKLHALHVFKETLQWFQVGADVFSLLQCFSEVGRVGGEEGGVRGGRGSQRKVLFTVHLSSAQYQNNHTHMVCVCVCTDDSPIRTSWFMLVRAGQ